MTEMQLSKLKPKWAFLKEKAYEIYLLLQQVSCPSLPPQWNDTLWFLFFLTESLEAEGWASQTLRSGTAVEKGWGGAPGERLSLLFLIPGMF